MKQQWVILQPGTPQPADFATTGGDGGPVIINTATKALYYLDAGNAVTALATGGGGSAFTYSVVNRTAGYTETTTTGCIVIEANLAAGFTITLPTAVGNLAQFVIKKMLGAGQITVATTAAQTIDGGATAVLNNAGESITIISNGAQWDIM